MTERPQNPRPMVRCAAGLDPDHRRCKRLEEGHHLFAPQLLTQNHLLGGVHPMKLEKMFRCIHANSANLFHGRSPLFEICNDLILAQSMPSGAVHPNTRLGHSNYHAATAGLGHFRRSARVLRWSGEPQGPDVRRVLRHFEVAPGAAVVRAVSYLPRELTSSSVSIPLPCAKPLGRYCSSEAPMAMCARAAGHRSADPG